MRFWIPIALLALGLGLDSPAGDQRNDVDLSGEWRLNDELSDDPREKLEELRSKRGGGRSGGGMGGGRRGGRSGGGGPGGDMGEEGGRRRGPFGDPEAVARLSIEYAAPALTVIDGLERGRVLYTDGRKVNRDYGEGSLVEVEARWKKGVLEVERKGDRGTRRERYSLSEDGRRLTIEAVVEMGRMGKIEIQRVYDRAEAPTEITPQ